MELLVILKTCPDFTLFPPHNATVELTKHFRYHGPCSHILKQLPERENLDSHPALQSLLQTET